MNLKFLFPLVGVAAGIFLAHLLDGGIIIATCGIALALGCWIVLRMLSKDPMKGIRLRPYHYLWILLLFFGIGALDYEYVCRPFINSDFSGKKYFMTGEIEDVKILTDGDRYKIKVLGINGKEGREIAFRNVNILVKTDGYVASKGDIISFLCKPTMLEDDSDFAARMRRQGICLYANVKGDNITTVGKATSPAQWFHDARTELIIRLEKSSLQRETSEFLISLLLGEKSFLSSNVKSRLSSAGLAHILALSGMHVGIILSILLFLLFPLSFFGKHKIKYAIAIALIWVFVFLSGSAPSTLRAAIMATMMLLAVVMERKNTALNALFAAALIILLLWPLSFWDIGFQLSFFCVASILLFTSPLNPVEQHLHPFTHRIINALLITITATFATWVLVAYYFGEVPVMFLPANLILLPLLPVFVGAGMLYTFLLCFGIDFHLLAEGLDTFRNFFLGAADIFVLSKNPTVNLNIPVLAIPLWITAVFLFGMAIHSKSSSGKKLSFSGAISLVMLTLVCISYHKPESKSTLKFAHSFNTIEARVRNNGELTSYYFPRQNISRYTSEKVNIISIDNAVVKDSLDNLKKIEPEKLNYLIVGPLSEPAQMADLISGCDFSKVVLHAGVGEKKKTELLSLLDESLWEKIYSLRENGSLEFDF